MPGYPDWQKIQQWLGSPIVQATGYALGAGSKVEGPLNLASWASIIVAVKATGGTVTITVDQAISGGPASLVLSEQFVIPAGQVAFEAVVLYGDAVTVTFQGSAGGETLDYAVYASNTTTNAQVLANATINVQKAGVLVAAEPTLDFLDGLGIKTTIADDAGNTRVLVTIDQTALADTLLAVAAASIDVQNLPATYAALVAYLGGLRSDTAGGGNVFARLNNDSAGNYDRQFNDTVGGVNNPGGGLATTAHYAADEAVPATGASYAGGAVLWLPGYRDTTFYKTMITLGGTPGAGVTAIMLAGSTWKSTNAVNRLTLFPAAGSFLAGCRVTVEGRAGV